MKLYCPITIDLYKVYPLQVMEAQQGNVGRGAIVTLTAGSAVIDPTDETVEVYAKKPDGTVSWLECSVEDGKIKIDFTNQMLMSPGILQVELRMKDDEDDITTPIFKVKVNKSNVQSAGRSENELPLLDQIKKNAEDAKAAAEAAEKAVGDKITNPSIGAVGQILEVESVDEKGKPLTYKAVDKPEGGVDKELSQIIHSSKYGIVSDGFSDTVIVIGKDAAAGDVIKYVIEENSGDITVIYDNNDTGEFNITTIDHAGEAAGEKTLTAEKYCTYTFPSEMDVYLPFNIPAKTSQLTDDVGFAKQEEVGKLSEEIGDIRNKIFDEIGIGLYVSQLPNVTKVEGVSTNISGTADGITLRAQDGYYSYFLIADRDCEIYVSDYNQYYCIGHGSNYNGIEEHSEYNTYLCENPIRLRNKDNNLPTEDNKLTVKKGDFISFTFADGVDNKVYGYETELFVKEEFVDELLALKNDLSIEFVNDTDYKISFGKYSLHLFYSDKDNYDMHNWNIGKIYYNDEIVVPSGTDIIGPIKIQGDNDFLSGVHGSSTTTLIQVYCDGEKVLLNSELLRKCNSITIQMIDECRSEATLEHVFDRYVTIEITKNKIHICNTFKCVSSSDVVVERATNGGLIAVRTNILTGGSMNNYVFNEPPLSITNVSKNNVHAIFNLTMGSIIVNNILGKENPTYNGRFTVFSSEEPPRIKSYFDIMKNETVSNGQEICGEFEYIFR